jgi:glycosyltransferase involved in cell wall biosynthesis
VTPVVLHVIETLGRGGAEACLVAGLPSLREAGWDARVLALNAPYDLASALLERGVPVFCGPRDALKVARGLARNRPAVVHTHLYRANMLGRVGSLPFRVPVVTTLHNPDYGAEGPGWMGIRRTLDRWTFRLKPPTFIAVSQAVLDDYEQQMGYAAAVIPNAIDSFWLTGLTPSRDEARAALGLSGGRPLVFSAGRLHEQKGFDTLAEAASSLPDVDFVVAGEGPQRDALGRAGTLRLVGVQSREKVRHWIAAADVVAVPSRYESFGIFAAEAMACGRALVAADVPGLRTTVAGAALLVQPETRGDLADAIHRLISNADLRRDLEAKGPALAARFTPRAWAARLSDVYASVLRLSRA